MSAADVCQWMLRFKIVQGDITKQKVDAVVNAANEGLLGGGGVDGAIHRAAGPKLLAECRTLGGCPTGKARVTAGYDLPARHVIHTVGPVWLDGKHHEDELLAQAATRSVFLLAAEHGLRSLAFPAISAGAYGFPIDRAAAIAVRAIKAGLEDNAELERVVVVCYNAESYEAYREALQEFVP